MLNHSKENQRNFLPPLTKAFKPVSYVYLRTSQIFIPVLVLKMQHESTGKLNQVSCRQFNTFTVLEQRYVPSMWSQYNLSRRVVCVCVWVCVYVVFLWVSLWGREGWTPPLCGWLLLRSSLLCSALAWMLPLERICAHTHTHIHKNTRQWSDVGLHITIWSKRFWKITPTVLNKDVELEAVTN